MNKGLFNIPLTDAEFTHPLQEYPFFLMAYTKFIHRLQNRPRILSRIRWDIDSSPNVPTRIDISVTLSAFLLRAIRIFYLQP